MLVWLNGDWKEEGCAGLPLSEGLLRGEGVFETMASVEGRLIEPVRHWERFKRGAEIFQIPVVESAGFVQLAREVVRKNQLQDVPLARVRVTLTAESLLVTAHPAGSGLESVALGLAPFKRNEYSPLSGIKALSYAENSLARLWGERRGFDEVLVMNTRDQWCEGTLSNIFAIEGDELVTPGLESGCLPGVTRELVMDVARSEGIRVREEAHELEWVKGVAGLLTTSSVRGVLPVSSFAGEARDFPEMGRKLQAAYRKRIGMRSS